MDAITRGSAVSAMAVNRQNASAPNVSSQQSARNTASASSRTDMPQRAQERRQEEQITNRQQTQRDQLQNVVSRSADGDTVQVQSRTEELLARSQDGQVTRREDQRAAEEAARRAQQERMAEIRKAQLEAAQAAQEQDNQLDQINSFAGYTSSQLEQLYAQGRISRQDYEKEMATRQEREDARTANNSQMNREAARLNGVLTRTQMDGRAIQTAFSDRASQTTSPGDRIDAMQRIQDQRTQQTVQTNNEGRRTWAYQLQA